MLDRTRRAAAEERELIQSAFGAVEAISAAARVFQGQLDGCDKILEQLIEFDPRYTFAGFVDLDGQMTCSSTRDRVDMSTSQFFQNLITLPERRVDAHPLAALDGRIALNVSVPVSNQSDLIGYVWISIPLKLANALLTENVEATDLLVFNNDGEILATEAFQDDRRAILPQDRTLEDLTLDNQQTFRAINRRGEVRDFAVVPIVDDTVYALGSWEPRNQRSLTGRGESAALYFPLLMWIAAMAVAYFGVNRLVVRHVRKLRQWMRLYAGGKADFDDEKLDNAPEELEIVAEAFRSMTHKLAEQDRLLKEDLEEKTTLLREVHHRVKNNLQLISSIMNIQIRNTQSDEAKHLLRRVQDRVMALSAIHRYLYLSRKLSMVRADQLLDDIIKQLVVVGSIDEPENRVAITTDLSPVEITPDQSVPLTLLATEAAINSVKYCGAAQGEVPWINIVLRDLGENRVSLSIVNSHDPDREMNNDDDAKGSGLGSRLIDSFVSQLDGTLDVNRLPDRFELHLTFTRLEEDQDEDIPLE
ncbi:histidine kinase dimerization/phosphoacceptor domain -containing protein [uncultured Roseovarius sp.]|uniref:sensor histidine kinase n=1 Tax=uncultured Roseovarius sp. TaxID=293344 RepID=UPI0026213775|nr:histidine kinase dimerization/phosphoacceptor domain -containing protein [uncultured Roseovarius sp.]